MEGVASSANWLFVGAWVERELDDFADIWAAAKITALGDASVDLEYEDGCCEAQVPIDECRPHNVAKTALTLKAPEVTEEPRMEETQAVLATNEEVVAAKPKTGLLTRLRELKAESLSLTQRVGTLQSQTVPRLLHRLGAVSVALLDSAFRLRPFVQTLGQLTQRHEPVFTDLSALVPDEETTSDDAQRSKQPTSLTYMLPVVPKQRDRAASSGGCTSPSLPLVGSPSRSLLRRRPESRGALKQPSAMLLDLGVEPAASGAPLALTLVDVHVAGKKLRASSSCGEMLLLPSSPVKATLRLPSLPSSLPAIASQPKQGRVKSVSGKRMDQVALF
eukprot:TRINITY_DN88883_c0_g1_i1.p1 TRINITY_DN88883_c0_g1~~TRINITY_DN88883_c0_g1_i1.p1  ORF type:complete len:354 (+),score=74.86 TRINITY_DN88883_c0_g1_i1:65-1063(+)